MRRVPQPDPKPWTVAIYMIADGRDGNSALDRLAEKTKDAIKRALARSGASRRVNVAIQMDFKETRGTRRLIVRPRKDWEENRREANAGDPQVLKAFLRWVHRECPAERYLVHFWGHSTGPVGLFFDKASDDARPDGLTMPELGYSLESAKTIFGQLVDIVLLKDCWLSTLEASVELRGGARYMVATQTEVPTAVWPYKKLFQTLSDDDPATVAASLVGVLGDHYDLAPNRIARLPEIPFSAVDVEAVRAVDEPLAALAARLDELRDGAAGAASRLALRGAARGDPAMLDVLTMCDKLGDVADPQLQTSAAAVSRAVTAAIVARRPEPSLFQGLSALYFPFGADEAAQKKDSRISPAFFTTELDAADDYHTLELCVNTGWDRIALENFTPPHPPANAKGARAMPDDDVPDKSDTFSIDWSGDTLTIRLKRPKKKKPKKKAKKKAPKKAPKRAPTKKPKR